MLPRFHAPGLDAAARTATLPPDEARHLTRVLRLGVGDEVAVFDGGGREFRATVASVARDTVRVELVEPVSPPDEPRVPLTLVQAVLKGDGMDDVVRDATMLGVQSIVPVTSAHVAVHPRSLDGDRAVERWRRVALASAKQCRRATLPAIHKTVALDVWVRAATEDLRLLLVEPSAACQARSLREWIHAPVPRDAALIVGPEGGWDPREIADALSSGCVPVTLGPLTLRADAMALSALSIVNFVFEGG